MTAQQTLVYSPDVRAHIYSRRLGSAIDVSKDIIRGSVNRNIDAASTFSLTLRNEQGQYTGVLARNDRIVVWLKKLEWIQVFSGYLDTVPFLDVYPTDAEIKGTCTIKRLRDYYWDPGLAENAQLFEMGSEGEMTDGGATAILKRLVGDVGGFSVDNQDASKNRLWIQEIPTDFVDYAKDVLETTSPSEYETILLEYLGGGSKTLSGSGSAGSNYGSGDVAKLLEIASNEIGFVEGPNDANKYGTELGRPNLPWCALFVSWCAQKAGLSPEPITQSALVRDHRVKHQSEGREVTGVPEPGDLFILMPDTHIGFVESANSRSDFTAIEGNAGVAGEVARTNYRQAGVIFVRPKYPDSGNVSAGDSGDLKALLTDVGFTGSGLGIAMGVAWATSNLDAGFVNTSSSRAGLFGNWYRGQPTEREKLRSPRYSAQKIFELTNGGRDWSEVPKYTDNSWKAHQGKNGTISNTPGTPGYGDLSVSGETEKWLESPISGASRDIIGFGGQTGCTTQPNHRGIDYIVSEGTNVRVVASGSVKLVKRSDKWGLRVVVAHPGGYLSVYAKLKNTIVAEGQDVKQGDVIATTSASNFGLHFEVWDRFAPDTSGHELNPTDYLGRLNEISTTSDRTGTDSGALSIDDVRNQAALQIFNALYRPFETNALSMQLQGKRARMNDVSLLTSVSEYVGAGMRRFMSSPTGDFLAFFPDYFGTHGTAPSLKLSDVELVDMKVKLDDKNYTSHVFSVIDTDGDRSITLNDKLATDGVVTLEQEYTWTHIVPDHPEGFSSAAEMMQVLGVRPADRAYSSIRNQVFGWFLAVRDFQIKWSQQYLTTVSFTFMPELFPGMRVEIGDHGVEVFVESVQHSFDFKSGFRTTASISCPVVKERTSNKVFRRG